MTIHASERPAAYATANKRLLLRVWRGIIQASIVAAVAALAIWLGLAVREALGRKGIEFSFAYLWDAANISLSEGMTVGFEGIWPTLQSFNPTDSNAQALITGLWNTLKVAIAAIVLSTVLGTLIGIGRLSTNWLVRNLSFGLVECVRNTPILIQLVFWYFAVVLQFPPASAASNWFGGMIASRAGVFLPGLALADDATLSMWIPLLIALLSALAALVIPGRIRKLWLVAIALMGLASSFAVGFPIVTDLPVATRFGARGGIPLSPELTAILLTITVNSSASVAEIVRGAIDSLPRGQWEAASSLGMSRATSLRDVILPQVFRIVLPSLANRYISLTKDTSLGIAIGFPDLFNVYGTVSNQTGRNMEGVIIVMAVYLLLSWIISLLVNLLNSRVNAQGASR